MTFLFIVLVLVCILSGVPLGGVLGLLAMGLMASTQYTEAGWISFTKFQMVAKTMASKLDNANLLAIPFFVLSGSIMAQGSLSKRMIRIAKAATGWMPSGLAVTAVVACAMFASVSGSSPATVVAVGSIMVPALMRAGYSKGFTVGLLTSAGSLGILIPPSIPMVIYGVITSTSIEKLFLGGLGAGLFMSTLFILLVFILGPLARKKGATENATITVSGMTTTLDLEDDAKETGIRPWLEGFLALAMPVIILGSIYGGIATAMEASAISVVYALLVEGALKLHYKEGSLKDIYTAVVNPSVMVGTVLIIVAMSQVLNNHFAASQLPDQLAHWMRGTLALDPGVAPCFGQLVKFLIIYNLLLLVVGCLMDIISGILIFVPLVLPTAHLLGIDPIFLGTMTIVNLEIGYLTPPIGLNLFVSSSLFNQPVLSVTRWAFPFVLMMLCGLVIMILFPAIITFIPGLYGGVAGH